jgi:hypothetical protein
MEKSLAYGLQLFYFVLGFELSTSLGHTLALFALFLFFR